jgi:hypothetical protein
VVWAGGSRPVRSINGSDGVNAIVDGMDEPVGVDAIVNGMDEPDKPGGS